MPLGVLVLTVDSSISPLQDILRANSHGYNIAMSVNDLNAKTKFITILIYFLNVSMTILPFQFSLSFFIYLIKYYPQSTFKVQRHSGKW